MERQAPDYETDFRCLAADCLHSCCIGWEVVIDGETAERYAAVPGSLGERLRRSLTKTDGETCFRLTPDRRCPFLEKSGLCEIHRRLGAEFTSQVCRAHPRFITDYGPLREISLSAACPAVEALLLGSDSPLTFPVSELPEPGEEPVPDFSALRQSRDLGLDLLRERSVPLNRRLAWLLLFANEVQALLDSGSADALPELCALYREEPELPELAPDGRLTSDALELLSGLEVLEPDWKPLLRAASASGFPGAKNPDDVLERIACYFFFRYFLPSATEGDTLTPAQMTVFSVLTVDRLAGGPGLGEALRRYCREIEHCSENLDALRNAFCEDGRFGLVPFFSALQNV